MADFDDEAPRKLKLKVAKGTRDSTPNEMAIWNNAIEKITKCFERHGAKTIDTPVFELKELLTSKYGEESKLIYDLVDEGGEILSLRYDLTVPFARYLAMNSRTSFIKRYQIGKVFRRENTAKTRGRFREFSQCDFDIAGGDDTTMSDVECIRVMTEIFDALKLPDYEIKINHRKILDGLFEACGVPDANFRKICSSVDKLDKISWDEVRSEMIGKNLSEETADLIGHYVLQTGQEDLVEKLLADTKVCASKSDSAVEGLEALKLFFRDAELYHVKERVKFDMSLARGLDYYTGIIFEATLKKTAGQKGSGKEGIGSIAGGGRYDNLVSLLNPNLKRPCVGVSIGIDRILAIVEEEKMPALKTQFYVVDAQMNLREERVKLCVELWENDIEADTYHSLKVNPQILTHFQTCEEEGIPYAIIIGQSELEKRVVKLRHIPSRTEKEVKRSKLVHHIKKELNFVKC